MTSAVTVYQKPTCTTCRQVMTELKKVGVDFEAVNYYIDPIPKKKLKELLKKMGTRAHELLRKKESLYKELDLANRILPESEIIDLLVRYPDLLQRPIVEKGSRAVLARPAERIREIF